MRRQMVTTMYNNDNYYVSKLVRALWLVNLAVRSLLHGPLKLFFVVVAKLLGDLSPIFLNLTNKSLKLSFTLNCVLKRAKDLKTISNWFRLAFDLLLQFEAVPQELRNGNRSQTIQTRNRDIINILLTSFSWSEL